MQVNLVVGDWSDDGHGKTDTITYEVNIKSTKELVKLHKEGSVILGYNLEDECSAYEDNQLSADFIIALKKHVSINKLTEILSDDLETDEPYIGSDVYAELYMMIASLSLLTLSYSVVKSDGISIGGYGLFY